MNLLQHRVRVVLRVMEAATLIQAMLAGGAIVVHVAHGTHAVGIVRIAVGGLKSPAPRARASDRCAACRRASPAIEHLPAATAPRRGRDGPGKQPPVSVESTADLVETEIIDHRPQAAGRVAGKK